MGDQIARAEEFEKKAEKNFKGWGLFSSKYEDATYRFDKAANSFKLAKSYAIEIYEEIARHSHNNLLKYRVKCHLLNAVICHLCKSDIVAITNALGRYQEMDPTFSGTREYRLLAIPAEVVVDFLEVNPSAEGEREGESQGVRGG